MADKKTDKFNYAGFGDRLLAAIIDGILLSAVGSVFLRIDKTYFHAVIAAIYAILLWVNWNGQTVGKKIMKIRIVKEDGGKVEYTTAIVRYICYFISAIPLFLGYLWVIWDGKKQAWHDKIASTVVIKEK